MLPPSSRALGSGRMGER